MGLIRTSPAAQGAPPQALAWSVDSSPATKLLPTVLSVIAGSTDVISFLGLGGLFTAHITGNLVLLAAHPVTGAGVCLARMLSVPVFILVLGLARVLTGALEAAGRASLRPLLLLQFLLLTGFLALGVTAGPRLDPNSAPAILAGMLGVSAMAVQNALVQIALKGAPATAVMTTNVTRFVMDAGEVLLGRDSGEVAAARRRAKHTWPAIAGFTAGAGLGAGCFAAASMWSLALPAGLGLVALAICLEAKPEGAQQ
jgi:uncharacterized membrane protein YoaK (UPF0700 family)